MARQPRPEKGPHIANPARLPGCRRARCQKSWHTKSFTDAGWAHRAIRGFGSDMALRIAALVASVHTAAGARQLLTLWLFTVVAKLGNVR
jgi:hypothetical protein